MTARGFSRTIITPAMALLSALAVTSCGACKEAGSEDRSSTGEQELKGQELNPVPSEVAVSGMEALPWGVESEPADLHLRQFAGEMDVKNVYASTVMISLKDPRALPDCSGILLDPRLVLTAASCVCALEEETPAGASERARADASSCVSRVFVTSVVYGEVGHPKLKELTTQMRFRTTEGSVKPHPELELVLDKRGFVVVARADLAVIQLDEPLEEGGSAVLFARDEVRRGESLVMAGFGHDAIMGGFYGSRYFRKNPVVDVRSSEGGRILYQQQGTFTYSGYDGGPCFREEAASRWLVGVASARADQELACTSTLVYRDWVLEQLKQAKRAGNRKPAEREEPK
jgi:hypothetical protein